MTPTERDKLDKLAEMAGAEIERRKHPPVVFYCFPDGTRLGQWDWHPETSHDDCRPLLEEIEEEGLWSSFEAHLTKIHLAEIIFPFEPASFVRWLYFQVTPADIVEAFKRTIEAVDKEKP